MSLKNIVKEIEEEYDSIIYMYMVNEIEHFTPNQHVAIKRNETNKLTILNNNKIVKIIDILN